MADISILSRLVNALPRNVDLTQNSLVVGSLKVGATSPEELTKTILGRLIALQNGTDVDATYHTHDGRYFTESELGATSGQTGSDLIGDDNTYSNFTPAAATVKGALAGIDAALGTAAATDFSDSAFRISDNGDSTKKIAFEASGITTGTVRTVTMPDANVNLADANNAILKDGSRAFTGNQSMGSNKLTNLADGTAAGDAVNKGQLDLYIPLTQKGANNGVATLDAGGKVPVAQLPSAVMTYEGVWNASTNSPSLADGVGDAGMVYRVSVAGTQNLGSGSITFDVGDYVIYNGSVWEKSDTTDAVASVNGQTGVVVLTTTNINEGTNLYFTDERAQDAVGTILTDTATIDFTYNDAGNQITADVKNNSIDENKLTASVAGDGLSGGNGTALSVNVDNSTIEINTDTLRLKDAGVTAAKLATGVADQTTITGGNGTALAVASAPRGVKSAVAGESMAANTSFLVRWAVNGETAGRVYKADKDATSSDLFYAWGVALKTSAVSAGDSVNVTFEGTHTLGSSDSNFAASDIGKAVYLTTSGAFSTTAPSATNNAVWRIGMVQDVDKIWVGDKQLNGIY